VLRLAPIQVAWKYWLMRNRWEHPNAIGHEVNMSCISEQMINILCLYVLVRWIYRPGM
jgi:hypothetical protein